jgi:hypothetical protein
MEAKTISCDLFLVDTKLAFVECFPEFFDLAGKLLTSFHEPSFFLVISFCQSPPAE